MATPVPIPRKATPELKPRLRPRRGDIVKEKDNGKLDILDEDYDEAVVIEATVVNSTKLRTGIETYSSLEASSAVDDTEDINYHDIVDLRNGGDAYDPSQKETDLSYEQPDNTEDEVSVKTGSKVKDLLGKIVKYTFEAGTSESQTERAEPASSAPRRSKKCLQETSLADNCRIVYVSDGQSIHFKFSVMSCHLITIASPYYCI